MELAKGTDVSEIIAKINPRYRDPIAFSKDKSIKPTSAWEHTIVYDSTSEQLEPVYFWLIDFLRETLGWPKMEKLSDNFSASPAGGYFSEIGAKATKMQEEGMKIMGTINTLIRTIINLIYDLKDFEVRLAQYDQANNKDKKIAEAGVLALKNIWLDKVDMPQRGRGSVHQMTYELGYTTLRDAFMAAKDVADVDKIDLNDRVKKVLKPRLAEFLIWKDRSEKELRKRFEIERTYLRSEVAALKLYTRWAKPYLRAAEDLGMRAGSRRSPDVVNAFNTMLLELTLIAKKKVSVPDSVAAKDLPQSYKTTKFKRNYYGIILLTFTFRGIPNRTPQGHYIFGGRAEVSLKSYSLNQDELDVLDDELEKNDLALALNLVEETTENSLGQLQEDIEHFVENQEEKKKKEKEKSKYEIGKIPKDKFEESVIRKLAERGAAKSCFKLYDIFKKAHGMASFIEPDFDVPPEDLASIMYKPEWRT
jgi:sulfur carrier protein ThiS